MAGVVQDPGYGAGSSADLPKYRFCVAPMMGWTDRHCRFFFRLLTKHALLYTEMITADALFHGDRKRFLHFCPEELPVALQLGGASPEKLAFAAQAGAMAGYSEINLNVGCPSDRVQSGQFGACLMYKPELVAECLSAMRDVVDIPVTVKCRIGVDDQNTDAFLDDFLGRVSESGCSRFIVHARMAWLKGLNPKENREVPPLDYARVYRLKKRWKSLQIILNGGIEDLTQSLDQLQYVEGVMLGRSVYRNPWLLSQVDEKIFGAPAFGLSREDIVEAMLPYIEREVSSGVWLSRITRHMLNLFQNLPGARVWRRILSEESCRSGAGKEVVQKALRAQRKAVLDVERDLKGGNGQPLF